jgi:hypothetical protein
MMYRPTPLLSLMHRPDDYFSKSPIWLSFQAVRLKYAWRLDRSNPSQRLWRIDQVQKGSSTE